MRDVLDDFHPLVRGWFLERFGAPTEPQRAGWPRIREGRDVLIAAPTGSGKTLAAFLACLDDLVRRLGEVGATPTDHTDILYISPLKALSNDVHRNLEAPLAELAAYAAARGESFPEIRVAVRTGDTPPGERAKMARHPPNILVTTPESLFILLTSEKGRGALARLRTVIVDEIHAVAGDKRGAHLALSLERLDRLVHQNTGRRPVRVGLSATQRPIERIAQLLVGTRRPLPFIADAGHRRELDLAIEITDDELGAVASNEQFGRVYDRIAELVTQHRSTIVFVNTRRLVERAAAALEQRLGAEHVVAHHGSMSRALRLAAEQRLKYGQTKCAVATASLELGIDVGAVDLVVQIGSPRAIATLLQRVGRSGHTLGGTPKGRLFALTRDQLVECAALVRGVRAGNLDEIALRDAPLDILAQQIVATCASEEISEEALAQLVRGAAPYAGLSEKHLEQVLEMLSEGVSGRRGRAGAHIHRDRIAGLLRGRRGARLAAITSGGAIPDNNTYSVVQWPEEIQVGTLDEDFAIESSAGDIFQLGNTAWRIRRIEAGRVLVEDARGLPPTIPFWLGEAPARTRELSDEVSALRGEIDRRLASGASPARPSRSPISDVSSFEDTAAWLAEAAGMSAIAARQLVDYLAAGRAALGALPRKDLVIAERFFDEGGGMQLILHAPFGGRINRAWGLALRKKFCRTFDFELQAAATDDGIVISLGQPHSFALDTVFGFVPSHQAEDVLVQALLDRPMFEIRWRWNVTRALTVLRRRAGKKVPPHLVKMRAADTLSVVFPQAQACPENLPGSLPGMPGDREIPDHPLVFETIRDCLVEAMDVTGFRALIEQLERGEIAVMARDTVEPSPLSHELINANPYAYLDDAPLEERRTRAVALRRGLPALATATDGADAIGALDPAAIAAALAEVAPVVRDVDELHDALLGLWLVPEAIGAALSPDAAAWFAALAGSGRAIRVTWHLVDGTLARTDAAVEWASPGETSPRAPTSLAITAWVATERIGAVRVVFGEDVACEPAIPTPSWAVRPEREAALIKIVGAYLDHRGPASTRVLAAELGLPIGDVLGAVLALEADGAILRGSFTTAPPRAPITAREALSAADDTALLHDLEWCNRRILARVHRLTLTKLRSEIEPVSAAALQRFLLRWQRVARNTQLIGPEGLVRILEQLQGFETAAGAWEREVLPARICNYDPAWLDQMCLAGQIVWCRLSPRRPSVVSAEDGDPVAELAAAPDAEPGRGAGRGRTVARLVAPLRDAYADHYDRAEAGAEAARAAGATREQIEAAAAAALGDDVPVRAARAITQLVTATAMLRNEMHDESEPVPFDELRQFVHTHAEAGGDDEPDVDRGARGTAAGVHGETGPDAADEIERAFAALGEDAEDRRRWIETQATRRRPRAGGWRERLRREPRTTTPSGSTGSATTSSSMRALATGTPPSDSSASTAPFASAPSASAPSAPSASNASGSEPSASVARAPAGPAPHRRRDRTDEVVEPSQRSLTLRTGSDRAAVERRERAPHAVVRAPVATRGRASATSSRAAPSRAAPLALMMRGDVTWLRAAAAIDSSESAPLGATASRIRDHLARSGASFLPDLVATLALPADDVEEALWELVGAGLATADGFASLRVLVDRKRGEVKSHFDRTTAAPAPSSGAGLARGSGPNLLPPPPLGSAGSIAPAQPGRTPVRRWQDAIKKARIHDRARPGTALRSLPTAAGRWSLLPPVGPDAIDAEASARQLLHRYGVVFRDLVTREACLPPWRELLGALRRLEARGEIRGGRFVTGFVGEQFALPEALELLRAARHPAPSPEVCRVAATDPLNLVGILSPGPRVPALVGNAVLYLDGHSVASLEAGEVIARAPIPPGARIDEHLVYHPPPRPVHTSTQAALPL